MLTFGIVVFPFYDLKPPEQWSQLYKHPVTHPRLSPEDPLALLQDSTTKHIVCMWMYRVNCRDVRVWFILNI